ncbi:MAG TPA: rod shape-determining protein RodA, partial [Myxococcaceae bacterium]|nr:rod shape-determining protein RodA [Myxococcaceae bacterium]
MLPRVPWGMIAIAVVIAAIGIFNLASAARPPFRPVWTSQTIYLALGLLVIASVCLVDYRFFHQMAIPIYALNIAALIALRFVGHTAKGAESWFVLGPIRVQPAEFMKIGVILMLARYYHDSYRPQERSYGLTRLLAPVAIVALPFVLVLAQPDLGTAMMIFLSSATVILFGRVKRWLVVALVGGLLAGSVVIWNDFVRDPSGTQSTVVRHRLKKHQVQRIQSWLYPEVDIRGASYHSMQSMIAVGSGEITGKGWKQGTQTGLSFLPEQHTDFIFSVWAEEHGFLACLLLLGLYGALLIAALGVAFNARDRFGAFVAVGVAAMIFWQVLQNIGMVIGLLPVTGITLPLMSYGGSSMISVMLSLGLVANVGM